MSDEPKSWQERVRALNSMSTDELAAEQIEFRNPAGRGAPDSGERSEHELRLRIQSGATTPSVPPAGPARKRWRIAGLALLLLAAVGVIDQCGASEVEEERQPQLERESAPRTTTTIRTSPADRAGLSDVEWAIAVRTCMNDGWSLEDCAFGLESTSGR